MKNRQLKSKPIVNSTEECKAAAKMLICVQQIVVFHRKKTEQD
jgi:hypothetical protein